MYFWETYIQTNLLYLLIDLTFPCSYTKIRAYQLHIGWKTIFSADKRSGITASGVKWEIKDFKKERERQGERGL